MPFQNQLATIIQKYDSGNADIAIPAARIIYSKTIIHNFAAFPVLILYTRQAISPTIAMKLMFVPIIRMTKNAKTPAKADICIDLRT